MRINGQKGNFWLITSLAFTLSVLLKCTMYPAFEMLLLSMVLLVDTLLWHLLETHTQSYILTQNRKMDRYSGEIDMTVG